MIEKILKRFGLVAVSELNKLVEEKELLEDRIEMIQTTQPVPQEEKVFERTEVPIVTGDPSPTDTEERKAYVARVGSFNKEILEPKLKQLISKMRHQFDSLTVPEEVAGSLTKEQYHYYIIGNIGALWTMIEWGWMMQNEHLSNGQGSKEENLESN